MNGEQTMKAIHRLLPQNPERAFALLPLVSCAEQRRSLGGTIAKVWSRQDINTAWNAVARSSLNAADKQMMFNELWS